jgi:hypothetical protein
MQDIGTMKGIVFVPKGWSAAVTADLTDEAIRTAILAALNASLVNDNPLLRAIFVGEFVNFEDKSEAAGMQSHNYGVQEKTNRGKYRHEYGYRNGGLAFHCAVKTFDELQNSYDMIYINGDSKTLVGANKYTDGVLTAFQGITLDFIDAQDQKVGDYTNKAMYKLGLHIADGAQLNEECFIVNMGQNMVKYCKDNSVIGVELTGTMTGTRICKVRAITEIGNVNLGDVFGDDLSDATLWVAKNKTSGAAITISSVGSFDTITKQYTITCASGGGYSATAKMLVYMAPVSTLVAGDIGLYESNKLELVMN